MKKQITQPLTGFRDFLPESMVVQNYIFDTWKKVCVGFGFEEYNGPLLENVNLYNKSGDDIGSTGKDLFNFVTRGGKNVALRPEMTPTVGRMIAAYGEDQVKPTKWFSIGQFFRAEKPQRGRTREFYQLNADIFGSDSVVSDIEIIFLATDIVLAFGATEEMFKVRINNRIFVDYYFERVLGIDSDSKKRDLLKIIDASPKKSEEWLKKEVKLLSNDLTLSKVKKYLNLNLSEIEKYTNKNSGAKQLTQLFSALSKAGYSKYCSYDPVIARGFDYYTGMVFEVFDNSPKNNRSMFGGGRYDNLLDIFDKPRVPAVGFAPGDVTTKLFLESWNLMPNQKTSPTKCLVTVFSDEYLDNAIELVALLRSKKLEAELYPNEKAKLDKQLKYADRKSIAYVFIIGPEEAREKSVKSKNMKTGMQKLVPLEKITDPTNW